MILVHLQRMPVKFEGQRSRSQDEKQLDSHGPLAQSAC